MAITFIGDTSRDGNTVSPLLDRISNSAGHLVVSAFAFLNQSAVTPPDPNPWAKFDPVDPAIGTGGTIVFGTDETLEIWWRIATGSDPSAWTFAADPGGRYCSGGMAFEGALGGEPPITVWSSQPNASSTSVTAPGIDPDYTAGVLLFFGAASSTGTWTPPDGFTQPASGSQPSAAAITLGFAYQIVSSGDAVAAAVATLSGAATNAGILLFVPAADASPEGGTPLTRTVPATVGVADSADRTVPATIGVSLGALDRDVPSSVGIAESASRAVPASVGVSGIEAQTVPGAVGIAVTAGRVVAASIGAELDLTRTIPATVGITGVEIAGNRTVPATVGVAEVADRTIPGSVGIAEAATRTVPATVGVTETGQRSVPGSVGVIAGETRSVPASLGVGVEGQGFHAVPASIGIVDTAARTAPATLGVAEALAHAIPATVGIAERFASAVPASVGVVGAFGRTVPASVGIDGAEEAFESVFTATAPPLNLTATAPALVFTATGE